ncbi:MAG: hypothetical protein KTR30_03710, partial [Saprospiraceae bacterium]|nr:hypothetical protein [Saprospiraceae bacterium]
QQLLKHLETPFAPIPQAWKDLSFTQALEMTNSLLSSDALQQPESLLTLMSRKALASSEQDQQVYLEQLFNPILQENPSLNYSVWKACSKFPKAAFSIKTKQYLQAFLLTQPQYLDKWLMLAGFATDDPSPIRQILEAQKSRTVQQAGKLALVRMGDEPKAKSFLKALQRIPIHDEFVYDIAPLAIYTRNKKVVQYIIDVVIEDRGNCHPADAETDGQISCGYRLAELLLSALAGVPKEINREMTGQQLLSDAKQWLRNNRQRIILDRQHL